MNRTPMELAALASAAIPDLSPTGVVGSPDDPRDFSAAVVFDSRGSTWRVRSPLHEEAAMRLETELQVLSGFTAGIRAGLPFRVPSVAGAVRIDGMRTFVYHDIPGAELELGELAALGGTTAEDIGRVIAAVHALPTEVVEHADLPAYTADQFRQRRLNELDQAATTGRIPAILLRRWEDALEEMELWDFAPVVTHGDLHEDNLLVDHDRLVSVTGWTDLHVGDPAEDFAWLASSGDQAFTDAVVTAYWTHRAGGTVQDEHLMRRAVLAAEFALAQWLVRGVAAGDEDMADEAEAMLGELRMDVEEHGGQEISAAPRGPHAVPPPSTSHDARQAPAEDSEDVGPDGTDVSVGADGSNSSDATDTAEVTESGTESGTEDDPEDESGHDDDPDNTSDDDSDNHPASDSDNDSDSDAVLVDDGPDVPAPDDTPGEAPEQDAQQDTGQGNEQDTGDAEPPTTALDLDVIRRLDR